MKMDKNINLLLFSLVFFIYFTGCEQPDKHESAIKSLKNDVSFLASDQLEGRETGSDGAAKAADFLAKRFKEIGLEPKGTDGYFQEFTFSPRKNPHAAPTDDSLKITARNVIGFITIKPQIPLLSGRILTISDLVMKILFIKETLLFIMELMTMPVV